MMSPTIIDGFSDPTGSWNTTCTSHCDTQHGTARPNPVTSNSPRRIDPSTGCQEAEHCSVRAWSFPDPDSPTRPTVSPTPTVRLASCTARTSGRRCHGRLAAAAGKHDGQPLDLKQWFAHDPPRVCPILVAPSHT